MDPRLRRWAEAADPDALLPPLRQGQRRGPVRVLAQVALPRATLLRARLGDGHEVLAPIVEADGRFRRAEPGDGVSARLLEAVPPLQIGRLDSWRPGRGEERRLPVDQTHDGVVVDDEVLVKWQVEVAAGEPAAPSTLAHLAAVGFTDTTPAVATVTWNRTLVAQVLRYLPGAEDGWAWLSADLVAALDARAEALPTAGAAAIGSLLGGFHAAMACSSTILPEPVTTVEDLGSVAAHYRGLLGQLELVDSELRAGLDAWRPSFEAAIGAIAAAQSVPAVRGHGDAHVGQVLRWSGGLALGDFDGNPLHGGEGRTAPLPTAFDVAAMRRSLDHVARVVERRGVSAGEARRLRTWSAAARRAFTDAYFATAAVTLLDRELLVAFERLSVLHEAVYASRFLPVWRYVPLAVLADGVTG